MLIHLESVHSLFVRNKKALVTSKPFITFFLMALASVLAVAFLVGFRGIVDDVFYVYGANQWLIDPPHLGYTHWEMRLPYILSIAASFGLFGYGNWQTALPGILCFCILVGSSYYLFYRFLPNLAAIFIAITLLISPIFFLISSYITPDIMEVMFVVISLLFFLVATQTKSHEKTWLLGSGVFAGLAMVTRFTSGGLILFFLIIFLLWPQTKRKNYAYLILGFVVLFCATVFLFPYAVSGDPFYRIEVARTQNIPTKDFSVFTEKDDIGKPDMSLKKGAHTPEILGPLSINKAIRPYVALLVNHEVGFLFLFLLPSIPIVLFSRTLSKEEKKPVLLVGLLAVTWFIAVTYIFGLRPHPRYYMITAFGAAVWVGLAFYILVRRRLFYLAFLGFAVLLFTNLLAGSLDGKDLYEEKRLIEIVKRHPNETIHVFSETLKEARYFLEINGLDGNISTEMVSPGGLLFFTPPDQYKFDPLLRPPESWLEVEPYRRRPTIIGRLLGKDKLESRLGSYMADRLSYSSPGSGLYRIPPNQSSSVTTEQIDRLDRVYPELVN